MKKDFTRRLTSIALALALLIALSAPAVAGGEEDGESGIIICYQLVSFTATDMAAFKELTYSPEEGFLDGVLYGVGGTISVNQLAEAGMPALESVGGFVLQGPDGNNVPLAAYNAYGVATDVLSEMGMYTLASYPIPEGFELAYDEPETVIVDENTTITFGFDTAVNLSEGAVSYIMIPLKPIGSEDPVDLYRQYIQWKNGDVPTQTEEPDPVPQPPAIVAKPTTSTVELNGVDMVFDAYTINGNNYFKLRDLAFVLSGTEKQFEINWVGETATIYMVRYQPYTAVGGEMAAKGDEAKTPVPTTAKIVLDGYEVNFTAYTIDNNNYFKLRDISDALDFHVEWDGQTGTIIIDTGRNYVPGL